MGILSALIGPVTGLLEKVIPDADERQRIAFELSTLADNHAQEIALAQIAVNREEAKGNWFQASWRPACAWVCVAGFAVNFLVSPLAAAFNVVVPQADTGTMMPVLLGMLGLASARSVERLKGVGK